MPGAILLTGPVGSGKTSVAVALGELLEERGESYALVDLDWLGWARAPGASPAELIAANLRAVWATFRAAGVEQLVLARHLRSAEELRELGSALEGMPLTAVRLDVPRAVLEERLRRRDTGAELAEHLELIARPTEPFEELSVRADVGSPRDVALAVLDLVGAG